jgi:hypothetical protein
MARVSKAARTVLSCCKSGVSTAFSLCSTSVQSRFLSFMLPRFGGAYHPRARVKIAAQFRITAGVRQRGPGGARAGQAAAQVSRFEPLHLLGLQERNTTKNEAPKVTVMQPSRHLVDRPVCVNRGSGRASLFSPDDGRVRPKRQGGVIGFVTALLFPSGWQIIDGALPKAISLSINDPSGSREASCWRAC